MHVSSAWHALAAQKLFGSRFGNQDVLAQAGRWNSATSACMRTCIRTHRHTRACIRAHMHTRTHTHAHALQAHLACSDYEGVVQIWDANANSEVRGRDGRGSHLTRAGERAGLKPHVIQLAQASEHMGVC